jgi:hypothetical protein
MYLADIQRDTQGDGKFHLYALGDIHRDALNCNVERLGQFVKHVAADPLAVCVAVGDYLEGRIPGMKHFDPECIKPDFLPHLKDYVNYGLDILEAELKPIVQARVPLVLVQGNHDDYLDQVCLTAMLAQRLGKGATYVGGEAMIRVRTGTPRKARATVGYYSTIVHAYHGSGGGGRPGSKINRQQQNFEWLDGVDIDVSGHVHDGATRVYPGIGVNAVGPRLQLTQRDRALFRAGTFVERANEGPTNYAGKKQYGSNDRGLQFLKIDPKDRRIYRTECEF